MSPIIDGLSQTQGLALIEEVESARNLLAYGTRALRRSAFESTTRDPVLTLLSIGVEKTAKMFLGLVRVAETGHWPAKKEMRDQFGHGCEPMSELVRNQLGERLHLAAHSSVVEASVAEIDNDPVWPLIVVALDRYGVRGRFYQLDILADNPQVGDSPRDLWAEAENAAITSDPHLGSLITDASVGAIDHDVLNRALNNRTAESIERWWNCLAVAAIQGMVGARGRMWGSELQATAVGRQEI